MAHKFRGGQLEARPRVVLPDPFYYLGNFESVVASLKERYADLWSAEELQFLATIDGLPKASRALIVRMVMRKGVLFRASRLNYREIGETAAAITPLIRVGWVDDDPQLDVGDLQQLLTKEELLLHFSPWSRPYANLTKPELVAMLRGACPEARSFHAWCGTSDDRVYRLLVAPICERFRLMFFGNFHQDWTEFVLRDLGVFVYEKVASHSRPFVARAHLEAFERLHLCALWLDAGVALDQVLAAIPAPITDSDWLEQRRQTMIFQVGQAAERAGDPKYALAVYSTCAHRGAHLRRIRILERAQEREIARDLCLAALRTSESEAEAARLRRLLPRLNRKLGIAVKSRKAPGIPVFEIAVAPPTGDARVEYCALRHFEQAAGGQSSVHYVENALVSSLFGLLCWRAIFAPLPGAFFHDFQYGPADLSSSSFYARRRREFADCFAELESGRYKATIRRFLSDKAGIQSPFVAWRLLSTSLLESALACFPAAHLRIWFEWIARDPENRAGFPDLVQFWPLERRYRMIEVKGPGDRLQDNQRRLLEHCVSNAMPVSVCRVRWA